MEELRSHDKTSSRVRHYSRKDWSKEQEDRFMSWQTQLTLEKKVDTYDNAFDFLRFINADATMSIHRPQFHFWANACWQLVEAINTNESDEALNDIVKRYNDTQ